MLERGTFLHKYSLCEQLVQLGTRTLRIQRAKPDLISAQYEVNSLPMFSTLRNGVKPGSVI